MYVASCLIITTQVIRWCAIIGCVVVSGWETDDSLPAVREYTRSLHLHIHFFADGYVLNIVEVNYYIISEYVVENQYILSHVQENNVTTYYLDINHKACFHKDTVPKVIQLIDFQSKVQLTCRLLRTGKL